MVSKYQVHVLKEGYSYMEDGVMRANGTSTLLKGKYNVIVDTLSPWDKHVILSGLSQHQISPEDINYVVCTHGHVDHIGNLNLFTRAQHIVGFSISKEDMYYIHPFEAGEPYKIDENIDVIPTPGHTSSDVSVIVRSTLHGTVAIVGDLFEREEDIDNPSLWRETAGSEKPELQCEHRRKIANIADYIIPGHGKMFKVSEEMRHKLSAMD